MYLIQSNMRSLIVNSCFWTLAIAKFCPFLGPVFPTPNALSSNAPFQASLATLESTIQNVLVGGNSSHGPVNPNDTYSIQIFSTAEIKPLLDFHRRGLDVVGNHTIDGDSIYRIASTTKAITVYLLLLKAGDDIFGQPVTRYLPELAGKGYWDEITVGALAGYMAGIVAEGSNLSTNPWKATY